MKTRTFLRAVALCGVAASVAVADDATFKAYGFADAKFLTQWYQENNFLRLSSFGAPDDQFNVDHVNTYFDWKPNSNVRFLAEVSLNRNSAQVSVPGRRFIFDSASVYSALYAQVGASTRAEYLQGLQLRFPTLPSQVLSHMADSMAQDTLSKSVKRIRAGLAAQPDTLMKKLSKDHGISLPRVHVDLSMRDEINLRVGRFITPAGIWNVDHGSPAIITVSQPSQTAFFPIFPESQTGIQAFGKTVAADQDLSYAAWVSTGRGGLNVLGGSDYGQDPRNPDDWAWGSHLQVDLGYLDGIRLGGTFQTGTIREGIETATIPVVGFDASTATPIFDQTKIATSTMDTTYVREFCYGLDTKIKWNRILVQAEWNHRKVMNLLDGKKETDFDAWYLLGSRSFPLTSNLELSPYLMYEWIGWSDVANNPDLDLDSSPIDGFGTWTMGLNLGIYSQVRLKLEYSLLQPHPWKTPSADYSDGDLDVHTISTQFSVAF